MKEKIKKIFKIIIGILIIIFLSLLIIKESIYIGAYLGRRDRGLPSYYCVGLLHGGGR